MCLPSLTIQMLIQHLWFSSFIPCFTSPWLTYFITGRFSLLIPLMCFPLPPFLTFVNHQFVLCIYEPVSILFCLLNAKYWRVDILFSCSWLLEQSCTVSVCPSMSEMATFLSFFMYYFSLSKLFQLWNFIRSQ